MIVFVATPILNSIPAFDAGYERIIGFSSSGGNQINKNNLVITNAGSNAEVYNETTNSNLYQHTLPANKLTNGTSYRFKIRAGDADGDWSEFSASIVTKPIAMPALAITNITGGLVGNQSYMFTGSFAQTNGELLESYRFNLYSQNSMLLMSSNWKYDGTIRHQFDHLENNAYYYVDFDVRTINGFEARSRRYGFSVRYDQPIIENSVMAVNVPEQAAVLLASQMIRLKFIVEYGKVKYIADEWADLTDCKIYCDEGFKLDGEFTIRLWLRNIKADVPILKISSNEGSIELFRHVDRLGGSKLFADKTATVTRMEYYTFTAIEGYSDATNYFIFLRQHNNILDLRIEAI